MGISRFSFEFVCLKVQKISVGGSFGVSFISVIENVWIGDEGFSRLALEFFLSHSAEHFRRGNPLVIHSSRVWKLLDKRGWGYQDFPSNVFYLTVPNISVGGVFSVSFISLWKIWIREDGEIKIFLRFFLTQSAEFFLRGDPLLFH